MYIPSLFLLMPVYVLFGWFVMCYFVRLFSILNTRYYNHILFCNAYALGQPKKRTNILEVESRCKLGLQNWKN